MELISDWQGKSKWPGTPKLRTILWMLCFAALGFLGVGLLTKQLFDRYLIPLLALLIPLFLLVMPAIQRKGWALAGTSILLLSYGTFGVLGTHDYMSWNEARWKGIHYLISEMSVNPSNIDGGYEVNYWYNYANTASKANSWWWTKEPLFYLTFTPLDGHRVTMTIPYHRSLPPPGIANIYVLYR